MLRVKCIIVFFLFLIPSASYSASLIYPDYLLKYECKNLNQAEFKPELERNWRLNTSQSNQQLIPGNQGGAIILWEEEELSNENEGLPRAYIQSIDSTGKRLWGNAGINLTNSVFSQQGSRIIVDGKGGTYVAWYEEQYEDKCGNAHDGYPQLRVQHINSSGHKLWGNKGIHIKSSIGYGNQLAMVTDGDGGFIIAYANTQQTTLQRFNSRGKSLWEKGARIETKNGRISGLWLSANKNSDTTIAWSVYAGRYNHILMQRVSKNGSLVWEKPVKIGGGKYSWQAFLAPTIEKGTYIAFVSSKNVVLKNIDRSGKVLWSREFPGDSIADVIADGEDGVAVLWSTGVEYGRAYYLQRFTAKGQELWDEALNVGNSNYSGSAGVISVEEKNLFVAWNAFNSEDISTGPHDQSTFIQRISSSGKLLWKQPVLLNETKTFYPADISFVSISKEEGIATWLNIGQFSKNNPGGYGSGIDEEPYLYDIYIQKIGKSGDRLWKKNGIPITRKAKPYEYKTKGVGDK